MKTSSRLKTLLSILLSIMLISSAVTVNYAVADDDMPTAYSQYTGVWSKWVYGTGTIADTGCGILSTTNALNYLKGGIDVPTFIGRLASWAHDINGFNGSWDSAGGTDRTVLYPNLQAKFGAEYGFTLGYCTWSGISSVLLKKHLSTGGVSVAHVYGHFIALVGYDTETQKYLVLDSAPSAERGTPKGAAWLSAADLSGTYQKMIVDWFCLITDTGTPVTPAEPDYALGNAVDDNNYSINSCDSLVGVTDRFGTELSIDSENDGAVKSIAMHPTTPTGNADNVGAMCTVNYPIPSSVADYDCISYRLYLSRDIPADATGIFQVNFGIYEYEDGYNWACPLAGLSAGWHKFAIRRTGITKVTTSSWNSVGALRLTWFNPDNITDLDLKVDSIMAHKVPTPRLISDDVFRLNNCDVLRGATAGANTVISLADEHAQGAASILVHSENPVADENKVGASCNFDFVLSYDISAFKSITMKVNPSVDFTADSKDSLEFVFTSGENSYLWSVPLAGMTAGWHEIGFDLASVAEGADWTAFTALDCKWINADGNDTAVDFMLDDMAATNTFVSPVESSEPESSEPESSEIESSEPESSGLESLEPESSELPVSSEIKNEVKPGDTDLDGNITASDALNALLHSVGKIKLEGDAFTAADIDKNGVISSADALTILQISVGKIL